MVEDNLDGVAKAEDGLDDVAVIAVDSDVMVMATKVDDGVDVCSTLSDFSSESLGVPTPAQFSRWSLIRRLARVFPLSLP